MPSMQASKLTGMAGISLAALVLWCPGQPALCQSGATSPAEKMVLPRDPDPPEIVRLKGRLARERKAGDRAKAAKTARQIVRTFDLTEDETVPLMEEVVASGESGPPTAQLIEDYKLLADLYIDTMSDFLIENGRDQEAEPILVAALADRALLPIAPSYRPPGWDAARELAKLYLRQRRYAQAEALYRVLAEREQGYCQAEAALEGRRP